MSSIGEVEAGREAGGRGAQHRDVGAVGGQPELDVRALALLVGSEPGL